MNDANAIEIRDLEKRYSQFQLGPLDLTVPRGCIYGFVGPNGAGKSTTIDLLFGMGRPDGGRVLGCGIDTQKDEVAMKKRAAYVGPELEYSPWGRIEKAIRFVRGFYPDDWDDDYCRELLTQFGLDPRVRISTLSFGSKTKLSLVLALSRRPELLVLDEPTTGLDAIAKQELFSQLLVLVADSDRSILISSHHLSDVERFADRIGIIRDGKMLHEGPTHEIVDRYCLVDLSIESLGSSVRKVRGVHLVREEKGRARVLIDRQAGGLDFLSSLDSSEATQSPVTLEDLFVSLLKPKAKEEVGV